MAQLTFTTTILTIKDWLIIHVPVEISATLPSRGLVMVAGTVDGHEFRAALEPDGLGSHWWRISKHLQSVAAIDAGSTVRVRLEAIKDWDEPVVPTDIQKGVAENPSVAALWYSITPMARWDWIRWIRATNNPETRAKHISVAVSKLQNGTRRPCCFNRNVCTEPYVARSGRLDLSNTKTLA